jgi:hypothetical protein
MEALKGKKLTKNSKSQDKYNKKSGITPTLLAKLNIKNEILITSISMYLKWSNSTPLG